MSTYQRMMAESIPNFVTLNAVLATVRSDQSLQLILIPSTRGRVIVSSTANWLVEVKVLLMTFVRF